MRTGQATKAATLTPTQDRDALWALAPRGARFGIVVSPRGVAVLERSWRTARALLASSPDFAEVDAAVMHFALSHFGMTNPTLGKLGFTADRGFALFVTADSQVVAALPVGDPNKPPVFFRGHGDGDGGGCKALNDQYVCVTRSELWAALGAGGLDVVRQHAGARGEIEVASDDFMSLHEQLAAAIQLEGGTLTVRGSVAGLPRELVDRVGALNSPLREYAGAAAFGVLDVTPMFGTVGNAQITPRVTVGDLARSVAGPMRYVVPAGASGAELRFPLNDAVPARDVIEHCTDLPQVGSTATLHDGACRIHASRAWSPELWLAGSELRVGERSIASPAIALVPTRLASELANGTWSTVLFSRGAYLDLKAMRDDLQYVLSGDELVLRALPLVSELGLGVRRDGDALQFVFGLRTAWSNPDAVVERLLTISADDLQSGRAFAIGMAIADQAPDSPFAQDIKAGPSCAQGLSEPVDLITSLTSIGWINRLKRTRPGSRPGTRSAMNWP